MQLNQLKSDNKKVKKELVEVLVLELVKPLGKGTRGKRRDLVLP